jgi:hypothetical protein
MRTVVKVTGAALVVVGSVALAAAVHGTAYAGASGGDNGGGTVSVGATGGGSSPGSGGGGSGGSTGGSGGGTSPWVCTYTEENLNGAGIAPGGPTPGNWYSVACYNRSTGQDTLQMQWIPDQSTATGPTIDPYSVALQAENSIQLPRPTLRFNPSGSAVVNLATWLWIDAGIWHPYSVSASVGTVSATAVATPVSVTWTMGDGGSVSCHGPGTAYNLAEPSSLQAPSCWYTYAISSAGQPAPDGNPNDGAFEVTATVTWSVSWTAVGAAGGGALPTLFTSTTTPERVEQVESVNSSYVGTAHSVLTGFGDGK